MGRVQGNSWGSGDPGGGSHVWQVFSVAEQESLGQKPGRGSSYNCVVHLTNDNICQVRFLEDAKQQGPKWLKVCLFGLFLK